MVQTSNKTLQQSSPEEIGEYIGEQAGIYETGRADVAALIRTLGGQVICQLQGQRNDLLIIDRHSRPNVYVGLHTTNAYDRYVIGKALGHYYLHYIPYLEQFKEVPSAARTFIRSAVFGHDEPVQSQLEAHAFSLGLLLPTQFVQDLPHPVSEVMITELSVQHQIPKIHVEKRLQSYFTSTSTSS